MKTPQAEALRAVAEALVKVADSLDVGDVISKSSRGFKGLEENNGKKYDPRMSTTKPHKKAGPPRSARYGKSDEPRKQIGIRFGLSVCDRISRYLEENPSQTLVAFIEECVVRRLNQIENAAKRRARRA